MRTFLGLSWSAVVGIKRGYKRFNRNYRPYFGDGGSRIKKVVLKSLILFLLIGSLFVFPSVRSAVDEWMKTSPYFSVDDIQIETGGNRQVSARELLEISGLKKGVNLWMVSVEELKLRIRAEPWVKNVSVSKRLPGKVKIEVKFYSPKWIWNAGSEWKFVDKNGIPFKAMKIQEGVDYPVISVAQKKDLRSAIQTAESIMGKLKSEAGIFSNLTF